jgi:hypothetical protein
LTVGVIALALITVLTLYAVQTRITRSAAAGASSPATEFLPIDAPPSADEIANGPRTVVPQGTTLELQLQTRLSTKTSNMGDPFDATVMVPVYVDGHIAIPAGATLSGHLILVRKPGTAGSPGQLQLIYDQIAFDRHSYVLGTRSEVYESKDAPTSDAAATDGDAVSATASTGVSTLMRGPQMVLAPGAAIKACLDEALHVRKS